LRRAAAEQHPDGPEQNHRGTEDTETF